MAISKVKTLLPLDKYAEYMMIPGWIFNQIYHPERPKRGCDNLLYQSGYYGDPNSLIGRDDIARAIARAEERIARVLGYSPIPTWYCQEEHRWPATERGYRTYAPRFETDHGYIISPGVETWEQITGLYPLNVVYSDEDGDGVDETATVSFATDLTDPCEIEIVPYGKDPTAREWRIRPLEKSIDGGTFTATGPTWLFMDPDNWLTVDEYMLDNPAAFLTQVEAYRHYNDDTQHAQFVWETNGDCDDVPCQEQCQTGCVEVIRARTGTFEVFPASYGSGAWARATWSINRVPNAVRIWYYAGYRDSMCNGCYNMGPIEEAIVRYANVLLPAHPCGCQLTKQRYDDDRKVAEFVTPDMVAAEAAFGTMAAGAVYAHSVIKSIRPLGRGG